MTIKVRVLKDDWYAFHIDETMVHHGKDIELTESEYERVKTAFNIMNQVQDFLEEKWKMT